ncbi:MAG: lysine--tRNA ligase [bacterium]|nr:lysine--tRNA ligase [bacterium]
MELPKEYAARLERLEKLRAQGIDPYPANVERSHTIAEFLLAFDALHGNVEATFRACPEPVEGSPDGGLKPAATTPPHDALKVDATASAVQIVGRVKSLRPHGGSAFAHIDDGTEKVQIYLQEDTIGATAYKNALDTIDVGDFLAVSGKPYVTKRGEKSVLVDRTHIICKALLPLPEKWHGLTDVEVRYRKRYLDLISNQEVVEIFRARSAITKAIREFFDGRGYLEVEGPTLHEIPGGAAAKPFNTHHNALGIDLHLRIALELHLKRLLVGGIPRVYEIGRCYRNEGIDVQHNPEFTMLEAYEAYASYEDYMRLVEELLAHLVDRLGMPYKFQYGTHEIDVTPPYPRLGFRDALIKYGKFDIEKYPSPAVAATFRSPHGGLKTAATTDNQLAQAARKAGVEFEDNASRGKIYDELYKTFVRPKLMQPTFVVDHPVELSPLAKRKPSDPQYVERFQLVLGGGIELVNAFSELNDPLDQKARFEEQEKAHGEGEEDTHRMDEDFIEALMHGMPPAAGLGIGIDRLVALLTNQHSIKEVILFPTLRPEK